MLVGEEAALLSRQMRYEQSSCHGEVHLLPFSAPVAPWMRDQYHLKLFAEPSLPEGYSLPTTTLLEIHVLAGSTYLDFDLCQALKQYLDVIAEDEDVEMMDVADAEDGMAMACRVEQADFAEDPADFLLNWLALRHSGDIHHTPVGKVCLGEHLSRDMSIFR